MVKEVIKYKAKDGVIFDKRTDAENHEKLLTTVDRIMSALPKLPRDIGFINGDGWIQHDESVFKVREQLIHLALEYLRADSQEAKTLRNNISSPGKIMDSVDYVMLEHTKGPIAKAYSRFTCINRENLREYGQTYFAINPDKAKGGQRNL